MSRLAAYIGGKPTPPDVARSRSRWQVQAQAVARRKLRNRAANRRARAARRVNR